MGKEKEEQSIFNDSDFSLFDEVVDELEENTDDDESQEEIKKVKTPDSTEEDQDEEKDKDNIEDDDESDEDESDESDKDESSGEDSSLFTPYANFLVDEGVLPNLSIFKKNRWSNIIVY